jgi:hypothetical protein
LGKWVLVGDLVLEGGWEGGLGLLGAAGFAAGLLGEAGLLGVAGLLGEAGLLGDAGLLGEPEVPGLAVGVFEGGVFEGVTGAVVEGFLGWESGAVGLGLGVVMVVGDGLFK